MNVRKGIKAKHWLQPSLVALIGLTLITGSAIAAQHDYAPAPGDSSSETEGQEISSSSSSIENIDSEQSEGLAGQQTSDTGSTSISEGTVEISNSEDGSRTSIKIDTSTEIKSDGETQTAAPRVEINGQVQQLPESGRFRQDTRTEEGRTRISGRINSDNTSINISTNESTELEVD